MPELFPIKSAAFFSNASNSLIVKDPEAFIAFVLSDICCIYSFSLWVPMSITEYFRFLVIFFSVDNVFISCIYFSLAHIFPSSEAEGEIMI